MPDCSDCGAHVSARFRRVFADDEGRVRCPDCNDLIKYDYLSPDTMKTYRLTPP